MDAGWLNGIKVAAETACLGDVDVPGGYWWTECVDDPPDGSKAPGSDRPPFFTWIPYQIVEGDGCAPGERNAIADFRARASRALLANESRKLELELWSGRVAHAGGFQLDVGTSIGNNWLANPDTATDLGIVGLAFALGEAVQYLAETTTEQGMIHAQPRVVSAWWSAQLLRREGNVIYENTNDHVVVPGTGYSGLAPDVNNDTPESGAISSGSTSSIYATSMVNVAEDDVVVLGDAADGVDRATNQILVRAERAVLAWWDNCAHGHIEVDLADPCTAATAS